MSQKTGGASMEAFFHDSNSRPEVSHPQEFGNLFSSRLNNSSSGRLETPRKDLRRLRSCLEACF